MAKRLTSIDFLRGIAIFFTTMMHFLFVSWEKFSSASIANIFSEPIGMIIVAALIFVLIHWRGFFIMISSVANFYQLESSAKKGKNVWALFGKQIFAVFILGVMSIAGLSRAWIQSEDIKARINKACDVFFNPKASPTPGNIVTSLSQLLDIAA